MAQVSLLCVLLALLAVTTTAEMTNCSNILRGRGGIPGRDGRDGRDGLQGPIGPQGPIGVRGEKGHPGEFPGEKGEKGVPGEMGYKGDEGLVGKKGNMGEKGYKGDVGPSGPMGLRGPKGDTSSQKGSKGDAGSSGVTYIRWGRTVCPKGTSLVYSGVAAGTKWDVIGGTSDTLCLASNPQYKAGDASSSTTSWLSGVRNEVAGTSSTPLRHRYHTYLPCALCYTTTKSTSFMLPGRYTCPSGWSTEYAGYTMTEVTGIGRGGRRDTICVDQDAEAASTKGSEYPALLYLMQVSCTGIDCPPFISQKPLTCVVCSK